MFTADSIKALCYEAMSGDVIANTGTGVVRLMAQQGLAQQQDIAVAFEMLSLLECFIDSSPIVASNETSLPLKQGVYWRAEGDKVALTLLVNIAATELSLVAFWLSESIPSERTKAAKGTLALPFIIETHDDKAYLMPDWFAAFYVDSNQRHCIPMMALKSITSNPSFGGNWVDIALARMPSYGLHQYEAESALARNLRIEKATNT